MVGGFRLGEGRTLPSAIVVCHPAEGTTGPYSDVRFCRLGSALDLLPGSPIASNLGIYSLTHLARP